MDVPIIADKLNHKIDIQNPPFYDFIALNLRSIQIITFPLHRMNAANPRRNPRKTKKSCSVNEFATETATTEPTLSGEAPILDASTSVSVAPPRRRVIRKATAITGGGGHSYDVSKGMESHPENSITAALPISGAGLSESDVIYAVVEGASDAPNNHITASAATTTTTPTAKETTDAGASASSSSSLPEPTHLACLNPHPRDEHILFDAGPHTYTIYGEGGYTSVTTWIHSHFGHFNADAIISKMMRSPKWPENKYYGMTREEIKAAWDANRDEAATAGTAMHYDIECFYNGMTPTNTSIEFRYFTEFEAARTNPETGFGRFLRPFRTEWMVYFEEAKLAGSIDMVYEDTRDGTLQIYDWKRSKEIKKTNSFQSATTECISHLPDTNYWHYSLQLNLYRQILQRKYGKVVVGLYLVVLHPDNRSGTFERIKVPFLETEMADLLAERISEVS